jgi:hypothetical protein
MHMETTTIKTTTTENRRAAVNGLAIVGFIVLVIIGMALAVYAARFVPTTISRIGSAAVYLSGQVFSPEGDSELEVVTPDETVPFGENDGIVATSTATTSPLAPVFPSEQPAVTPVAGLPTTVTVPVQVPASANYSGLPDLAIEDVKTGYLRNDNVSSFVASNEVPDGEKGAVKFTVINRGTNVADDFDFDFRINTSPSISKNYKVSRNLRPQERIEYTLWFDRVSAKDDRTITLDIDPDNDLAESDERNNDKTVSIDIER